MTFFSINNSLNKSILGHYPQVKEIIYHCDVWDEPRFVERVHFNKIDFEPITANAVLYARSKPTDLISVVGMGFTLKLLVSTKLKEILERNRNTGLQFFKAPIIHNEQSIDDYWILNFFEKSMEAINYELSDIYITHNSIRKIEKLELKSYNEFLKAKDNIDKEGYPKGILIEKFKIKGNIHTDFLLLTDVKGGAKYIVSENLKQEIEDANCTGIEFQPVELSINEWLQGGEREKIYGKS
ncbi:imm11 family protein [Flavobacterium sp.]|uniref:imm11 family protein n=1 Tax=Flavobacterium sp. TaxID=239 RepID=UPI003D6A15CF